MELINDAIYECEACGEVIQAFTSSGSISFCTCCGNSRLEEYGNK